MHIKPTLTACKFGDKAIERDDISLEYCTDSNSMYWSEEFANETVEDGYIHLNDCTDRNKIHCERRTDENAIINPVRSARLTTNTSFSFKYGRVEIRAKLPQGDWLWPGRHRIKNKSNYDSNSTQNSYRN